MDGDGGWTDGVGGPVGEEVGEARDGLEMGVSADVSFRERECV